MVQFILLNAFKHSFKTYFAFFIILLSSCDKDEESPDPLNLSDDYSFCNSQLSSCVNGNGTYCLFGYKWGNDSTTFLQSGYNVLGPATSGGIVTYSFQEENGFVNTHRQINLPSGSFDDIIPCAKKEIRKALSAWAAVADLEFKEMPKNSKSDIKFYTADIVQSGIGYPNYTDELCNDLAGNIIIKSGLGINDCNTFYIFALHEIGHVLGLGHVETENVMNPNIYDYKYQGLQTGDSLGIIEIYGAN